jgi:protein-S-isoprenylcysteine O-methyltransferase Ste14
MYVGLFVAYVGGCLLVLSVWPVLLLAVPALVLDRVVIPHEEATLRQAFGADFDAYCARVRRWIGRRGR